MEKLMLIFWQIFSLGSVKTEDNFNFFRIHYSSIISWQSMPKFWFLPFCVMHHKLNTQLKKYNSNASNSGRTSDIF